MMCPIMCGDAKLGHGQLRAPETNLASSRTLLEIPIVPQLDKCLKFMAFQGDILYREQSFLSPRIDLNLSSCDTTGPQLAMPKFWESDKSDHGNFCMQYSSVVSYLWKKFRIYTLREHENSHSNDGIVGVTVKCEMNYNSERGQGMGWDGMGWSVTVKEA